MQSSFMNISLRSPVIIASSPATENINNIIECWKQGAGAVILKTGADYCRTGCYKNRKWYWGEEGEWSQSTFEREIFMISESCNLVKEAKKYIDIPVIASITENSGDISRWVEAIQKLTEAGADMIQLDLFYISQCDEFSFDKEKFVHLLKIISESSSVPIIPKININFPPLIAGKLIKQSGIKGVSLLDSVRVPPPISIREDKKLQYPDGIGSVGTSYFGQWQLPLTESYLHEAVKNGLETCAGGGVYSSKDGIQLLMRGAKTIQIATGILKNGFSWIKKLNDDIDDFLEENEISLEELYQSSVKLVKSEENN